MKLMTKLVDWVLSHRSTEQRTADGLQVLYDYFDGAPTLSGMKVSEKTAMSLSAVSCAVRIISETVGRLPLKLYRKRPDGEGRDRIQRHPVLDLLEFNPNDEMTAADLRSAMTQSALLHGNGYAEIVRKGTRPKELWLLNPLRTRPYREKVNSPLLYKLRNDLGEERTLPADRVLHLKGMGDGLVGQSVLGMARESLGTAIAAERTSASFFGNAARPSGVLEHPGTFTPEGLARLKASWKEAHQGVDNMGSVVILEEEMKWKPMSIPPADAQFIETRKLSVADIARWFNIPPHMLKDLERATFSNIEHQAMEFVCYTLMPWLEKWEDIIRWRLMTMAEARVEHVYVQHNVDALLRGDTRTRNMSHKLSIDAGWKTRQEVRDEEDLNPIEGLDKPLKALNYETIGEDGEGEANDDVEPPPDDAPDDPPAEEQESGGEEEEEKKETDAARAVDAVVSSQREMMMHIAGRLLRREAKAARAAAKKPKAFGAWVDRYYERLQPQIEGELTPMFRAFAGSLLAVHVTMQRVGTIDVDATATEATRRHVAAAKGELMDAATESISATLATNVAERVATWDAEDGLSTKLVDGWITTVRETICI